ncbi:trigger factor [Clostridium botulinum]|uniref:Trigger factor n=1 Tax=Clostridium botulinum C/D str. DC5 TaxID=1443128 RepID=A0A0A0IGW8_CLOBO|nr:trigger factor [Clostridium botulinum]KGM99828.1 trigger factor [Clostridium botulinum C/D str. DC5]KOC56717.1 trigger factor [Clostridium botulinum]KOC58153.1 trigger factor [Clostridium botulinum]MCD3234020.1 trigger factor [Clostridium botulinum D/C]MCD3239857.1 trigger factor [Clostridium botulinum D/C]
MNTKIERVENNVVKLEITVEKEKFNEAIKKAYKKNAKRFNIPGFRKGKAPMNIITRFYGEGVFYEDAINTCCEEAYPQAVEEHSLQPVDYPKIDVVEIGSGKDFVFTAEVVVRPEVKLDNYKGVEAKRNTYTVKEEDVEKQLNAMLEKNARIITKEEGATVQSGDIAVIDFKGFIDGEAFEGGEGTDYSLEIGTGTFIDDFEDQLVGLKVGEEKEVNVKFPEQYGRDELNGKQAMFEVKIKEIKVKELPALDDEFAKETSEFDTLEELKADVTKKLEEANKTREKNEYEEAVIEAVSNNAEIDIPEVMIEKEIDMMIKDLEMRLGYQGLDLASYYQYTNSSESKVREYMKETAEKKVKTELILEKIVKDQKIEATEEEIKAKAKEMAQQYGGGQDADKLVDAIMGAQKEVLANQIANEKAIDFLVENSKEIA